MKSLPAPPHVIWSCDPSRLDPDDPWTRRWWITQVLVHGRWDYVKALDWDEVRQLLPELRLPERVRGLWEYYFAHVASRCGAHADPAGRP